DPPDPGHVRQHHGAEPAQPTGLHHLRARGTHRIAIDASGLDLLAPSPFQRIVEANDHWPGRHERVYYQTEQHAGHRHTRPARPTQYPMILLKPCLLT